MAAQMSKSQLIEKIATTTELSKRDVKGVMEALTDVGRARERNEDSYYAGENVFAVADGLGGHNAGDVASRLAIEPIKSLDRRIGEARSLQLLPVLVHLERAGGTADPQLHLAKELGIPVAPRVQEHHVGDGEAPARLQDAVDRPKGASQVIDELERLRQDHAVEARGRER